MDSAAISPVANELAVDDDVVRNRLEVLFGEELDISSYLKGGVVDEVVVMVVVVGTRYWQMNLFLDVHSLVLARGKFLCICLSHITDTAWHLSEFG